MQIKMPADNEVKSELDLSEATQELLDWAEKHIGEDPETKYQILSDFRDIIYERGECNPHRTDDAFLLRFLRARSFKLESAYRLFVNYYDFKENNPEFFEGVNLEHLKKFGDEKIITVPPYREQTGRRILLYRMGHWDPEVFTTDEIFQATMIVLELAILEQRAQIMGGVCIFDLGGLSMQQAWYLTPSIAHKMIQVMVTSFTMKIHALHVVNQPWLFDMIYSIFKPFIVDRMRERIFFHGDDMESLHRHIDPKYLPELYGGVHPEYDYNDWMKFFYSSETIKRELRSLGYVVCDQDENKKDE